MSFIENLILFFAPTYWEEEVYKLTVSCLVCFVDMVFPFNFPFPFPHRLLFITYCKYTV